jgi:hypothetical protein
LGDKVQRGWRTLDEWVFRPVAVRKEAREGALDAIEAR